MRRCNSNLLCFLGFAYQHKLLPRPVVAASALSRFFPEKRIGQLDVPRSGLDLDDVGQRDDHGGVGGGAAEGVHGQCDRQVAHDGP